MKGIPFLTGLFFAAAAGAAPMRVALTFDDGFRDHYEIAAPLLESFGLRGTFNVVTDWIGQEKFMTWDQIRDLAKRGHGIASHTASHPNLVKLLEEGRTNEVARQISASREAVEREVRKAVPDFRVVQLCHPYVAWNAAVDAEIRKAGLVPMTVDRWNFGNLDKGDVCYRGRWMSTAEYLDARLAEGCKEVDILCHGVREGIGWEPFKTVEDFKRHLAVIARYRDEGRIVVVTGPSTP